MDGTVWIVSNNVQTIAEPMVLVIISLVNATTVVLLDGMAQRVTLVIKALIITSGYMIKSPKCVCVSLSL